MQLTEYQSSDIFWRRFESCCASDMQASIENYAARIYSCMQARTCGESEMSRDSLSPMLSKIIQVNPTPKQNACTKWNKLSIKATRI